MKLINSDNIMAQLAGRPDDGWISIQSLKAMLDAEANLLKDYALHKKKPYISMKRCPTCNKTPKQSISPVTNATKYTCKCGNDTGWFKGDRKARMAWNAMIERMTE